MKTKKVILALILLALGLLGVLSMLTMKIPIPEELTLIFKNKFSDFQIKLITLVNPTINLIVAVILGTLLYKRLGFKLPILEPLIGLEKNNLQAREFFKTSILGGVFAGVVLSLASIISNVYLSDEMHQLSTYIVPSFWSRILYGGITEELLMRFGVMTFITWIFVKLFKKKTNFIYWVGIILAALLFAAGHLPVVYQVLSNPSTGLMIYVILGNSIGGVVFGWLYWKKGLESAIIAHMFAHIVMLLLERIPV